VRGQKECRVAVFGVIGWVYCVFVCAMILFCLTVVVAGRTLQSPLSDDTGLLRDHVHDQPEHPRATLLNQASSPIPLPHPPLIAMSEPDDSKPKLNLIVSHSGLRASCPPSCRR
jgi:hypothetical protein